MRREGFLLSREIQKWMRKCSHLWRPRKKDESLMNWMVWNLCPYDSLSFMYLKITLSVSAIMLYLGRRFSFLKANSHLAFCPFNGEYFPYTSCCCQQQHLTCFWLCGLPVLKFAASGHLNVRTEVFFCESAEIS